MIAVIALIAGCGGSSLELPPATCTWQFTEPTAAGSTGQGDQRCVATRGAGPRLMRVEAAIDDVHFLEINWPGGHDAAGAFVPVLQLDGVEPACRQAGAIVHFDDAPDGWAFTITEDVCTPPVVGKISGH